MARRKTTTPKKAPAKPVAAKPAPTEQVTPETEALKAVQTDTKEAKEAEKNNDAAVPSPFEQAVEFVLSDKIEGGYVNDPRDRGGETNFGIAQKHHPKVNIKKLTREGAIAIYKKQYWDSADCDELSPLIAVAMFDCSVNQGPAVAKRLLQKAVKATADGAIGPKTKAAIDRFINKYGEAELVKEFLGWRLRRYAFTATASTYMRGWANRVLELQRFLLTDLKVA